jgi:hypothetical protein
LRLRYWIAADIGQSHDHSAAVVVERRGEELHVVGIDRAPLRTPYPRIAKGLVLKAYGLEQRGAFGERPPIGLAVDAGGVGRAVADMIREEIRALPEHASPRIRFWPITATGGAKASIGPGGLNVPKADLITAVIVALQEDRLRIGRLPHSSTLLRELGEYRSQHSRRGNMTYAGSGRNDDLVAALALAVWCWQHTREPGKPAPARSGTHGARRESRF